MLTNRSKALIAGAVFFVPGLACAQTAVQQAGPVTNNRPVMWARDHQIRQAAGSVGDVAGKMLTGGLSTVGDVCSFSTTSDQSPNILCIKADGSLSYNGTTYPISGGGGNVVGPDPTRSQGLVCWNNVLGTLVHDCDTTSSVFKGTTSLTGLQSSLRGAFGGFAQNLIRVNDTAWTTESVPPYAPPIVGLEVDSVTGGVANTDTTHTAIVGYSTISLGDNTAPGGKNDYWQGAYLIAGGNRNAGGTPGNEKGMAWGLNSEVALYSGATNWYALTSVEADMRVQAGASVVNRLGYWVGDVGTGGQGSGTVDCAFCAGVGAVSPGFKHLIQITSFAGGGQNATNSIMYADHLFNVVNILDLSNVGCTGNAALAFNNGTGIDCDGAFISTFGALDYNGPDGRFVIQNKQNAPFNVIIDAGAGAPSGVTQTASLSFYDNAIAEWAIVKDATTQDFRIADLISTRDVFKANQLGIVAVGDPNGTTGVQLTLDKVGSAQFTHLPAVAAGTGKRFLCIDTSTKLIYEGSGASCN